MAARHCMSRSSSSRGISASAEGWAVAVAVRAGRLRPCAREYPPRKAGASFFRTLSMHYKGDHPEVGRMRDSDKDACSWRVRGGSHGGDADRGCLGAWEPGQGLVHVTVSCTAHMKATRTDLIIHRPHTHSPPLLCHCATCPRPHARRTTRHRFRHTHHPLPPDATRTATRKGQRGRVTAEI